MALRVASIAYLFGFLAFILCKSKQNHHRAQHHQQLGALFIKQKVTIHNFPYHQHRKGRNKCQCYHKIS